MPYLKCLLLALFLVSPHLAADDRAELERALRDFLAGANDRAVHESFWTEDLIYTSSSGARYGKAEILAGFDDAPPDGPYGPIYGAEDVSVRVLDDVAVVTFRLTADEQGERVGEYFNTGVFRKDDGEWRAFTWQATRIPEAE